MKSHLAEDIRIARPRFHLQTRDGLYAPIAFLFVTERMRDDILHERALLVSTLPPTQRARQQKLFERYDPVAGARGFTALLELYRYPFAGSH